MQPLLTRNLFYFRGAHVLAEGSPRTVIRLSRPVAGEVPTVYRFAPLEKGWLHLVAQTEAGEPVLRILGSQVFDDWDNPAGAVKRPLLTWKAEATLYDDVGRELGLVRREENRLVLREGERERAVVTLHWKGEYSSRGGAVLDHSTLAIHHDQPPDAPIRPLIFAATACLFQGTRPKEILSDATCPEF